MDIASLVRIFELNPTDEFVDKRSRAVAQIKEKFKGKALAVCLANANAIAHAFAEGTMPDPIGAEIETAIRNESSSFIRKEQELQILVCALGAALLLVDELKPTDKGVPELFVLALLAGLAQLGPHPKEQVESLRQQFLISARDVLDSHTAILRTRALVPAFDVATLSSEETVDGYAVKVKSAANKTINPLIANAALDREELDLLWWSLSDWSETLKQKVSHLPDGAAVMVGALEVVQKLKRLPATAHAHIANRHVKADRISNTDIRTSLAEHKSAIWGELGAPDKRSPYPYVFPLVQSLEGTQDVRNPPELALHWSRDLTVELFLLLKVSGRIA